MATMGVRTNSSHGTTPEGSSSPSLFPGAALTFALGDREGEGQLGKEFIILKPVLLGLDPEAVLGELLSCNL